nr:hypothetical protein [Tanacetum cinerariifolium]
SESRTALQGQIIALQGQVTALQALVATLQGLARDSTHPEPLEEAGGTPPPSPIRSLGYRAAMIRLRDEAASISHLPPLQLPSASRREDKPEVTLPPQKRLDIALGPRYEVGESSSAAAARPAGGFRVDYGFVAIMDREIMRDPEREVSYGITDSWDEIVKTLQGAPVSTDTELGGYVREFETRVRQDTDEIYTRSDDEQTERQLLAGWLNLLFRDRRAHTYTRQLMETEARIDFRVEDSPTGIGDSFAGTCYHFTGTARTCWRSYTVRGAPVSTNTELGGYVREFESRVRQDMDEIYTRFDDEQTERQLLAGRLNMLFRDRRAHAHTRLLMEAEARMSREACTRAIDACDLVHGEVISLRTTVLGQIPEIRELQAADRRRHTVISELLRLEHRRSTETSESRTALQG